MKVCFILHNTTFHIRNSPRSVHSQDGCDGDNVNVMSATAHVIFTAIAWLRSENLKIGTEKICIYYVLWIHNHMLHNTESSQYIFFRQPKFKTLKKCSYRLS